MVWGYALVMLNKVRSFPSLLPNSIVATIPTYIPEPKFSVISYSVILYRKFC